MTALFAAEGGSATGSPVVLLHGFGGSHRAWDAVRALIEPVRPVIAFDLPGHGASLDHRPIGGAGVAAKAVLAALAERGLARWHLVGHSLGGAAAALAALRAPESCASLTLLAPGGFGPEINERLLGRYSQASGEVEIARCLESFFGWRSPVSPETVQRLMSERADPAALAALGAILERLSSAGVQGQLPVAELARLNIPVKVVWGDQDDVLPVRQAEGLPGRIGVHVFSGAGHMLPEEIPHEVARLVLENTRPASQGR